MAKFKRFRILLLVLLLSPLRGEGLFTSTALAHEIRIQLLGQPCLLEGPPSLDEGTLRKIHSLGPAQIYPTLSVQDPIRSIRAIKKSLTQLETFSNLPAPVSEQYRKYRDRLAMRLNAEIAFLSSLESYQKSQNLADFKAAIRPFLREKGLKYFEEILQKVDFAQVAQVNEKKHDSNTVHYRSLLEELFDSFNDDIEPDPENEFHQATKLLKLKYVCSFEEQTDDEE